ncbi:MAG: hypothetical protein ACREV3_01900 [Gammaproteobacteria bacterium]
MPIPTAINQIVANKVRGRVGGMYREATKPNNSPATMQIMFEIFIRFNSFFVQRHGSLDLELA